MICTAPCHASAKKVAFHCALLSQVRSPSARPFQRMHQALAAMHGQPRFCRQLMSFWHPLMPQHARSHFRGPLSQFDSDAWAIWQQSMSGVEKMHAVSPPETPSALSPLGHPFQMTLQASLAMHGRTNSCPKQSLHENDSHCRQSLTAHTSSSADMQV